MRFATKVDVWIAVVLALVPISQVALAITARSPWILLGSLPILALVALLVAPCHYTLEAKQLVVRSGLVRWRIPYDQIKLVKPTHNPLSSPAWSLDRLWIDYGNRSVMVSPREKGKFLQSLARKANLRQEGKTWVRNEKG